MNFFGWFFLFMFAVAICALAYAWWQKFFGHGPDAYGKGHGHDPRGPERMQWDRIDETRLRARSRENNGRPKSPLNDEHI